MKRFAHAAIILTLALTLGAVNAKAQLIAERLYCGFGRSIPVTADAPATKGSVEVVLCSWQGMELERAPILPGPIDLAPLLPRIWFDKSRQVRLVQLTVAGEPLGSPLVLQPLLTQPKAALDPRADPARPAILFTPPPKDQDILSGLRVYPLRHARLTTTAGPVVVRLRPDAAANTAFHFRTLVEGGFYTEVPFHRVVPTGRDGHPFVIQTGDPTDTGNGSAGFHIDLEPSTLAHDLGVVSMARDIDPNTGSAQFFIALSRSGTARLDGAYCAFGEVIEGIDAVRAIAKTPLKPGTSEPVQPPVLTSAELIPAPGIRPIKPASTGSPAGTAPAQTTPASPRQPDQPPSPPR
jgi:cyclophilin family peptidyl-prolyl cis-trans isomerase